MIVPVAVLAGATFALLGSSQDATEEASAERRAAALRTAYEQVLVDMTESESAMRGYVITGDRSYLESFEIAEARLPMDIRTLTDLTQGSPSSAQAVDDLQALVNKRLSILQLVKLLAPIDGLSNHDQLIGLMRTGNDVADQLREVLFHEERLTAIALVGHQQALDASHHRSFLIGIVGMPLGVFASLILVAIFIDILAIRIRRTEDIARLLDEGVPLGEPSASGDELGQLERALVRTGTRMEELQSELRRMGTSDPMTRLLNRRGFIPTAEHQLTVATRGHQPMALMFLDLDGLKHVNDTLGHSAGDGMIVEAGLVLRETFRASDLIARIGGDEFCVLFATDSLETATIAITRLQSAVDGIRAQDGRQFVLSFSAGIAMFDPEGSLTLDQLMAMADERMYACKRAKQAAQGTVATAAGIA